MSCAVKQQKQQQPSLCIFLPEAEPRRDVYKLVRQTLMVAGMYPLDLPARAPRILHRSVPVLDRSFELFLYFVTLHTGVLYLFTLHLHYKEGNFEFAINCIMQAVIYFWITFMKMNFRRMQPNSFRELMDYIRLKYKTRSGDGFTYVTMEQCLALANKRMKIYLSASFIGILFWISLPVYFGDRSLPLCCWYPFDYKQPVLYEFLDFLQFVALLQVAVAFSSSSGFYFVSAMVLLSQYDILCCDLKNFVTKCYIAMGASKEDLLELRELELSTNYEPNPYYCAEEVLTPMHHIHDSMNPSKPTPTNFRDAFSIALKSCIDHHRYIKKGLEKMEDFYNLIWLLKTGEVIFLLCLIAFIVVQSTNTSSSFIKIFPLGQYLLLVSGEILIICYFSEVVFQNSQRCGEAILRSPWYLHIGDIRNDLLLFLQFSQQSIVFTAGKISILNVDTFRAIMKTAFSVFTLLQNLERIFGHFAKF